MRRRVHRDVQRSQAEPHAVQATIAGGFTCEVEAGRSSRAALHWMAIAREARELVADAPSGWDATIGRSSTTNRMLVFVPCSALYLAGASQSHHDHGLSENAPMNMTALSRAHLAPERRPVP